MKKATNLLGAVLVLSLLLGGCGETRRKPKLYVSVPQQLFVAAEGETKCEGYAGSCETRAKVSNAGTGTVTWKVTTDQKWLTARPESGTVKSGEGEYQYVDITVNPKGMPIGQYKGKVVFAAQAGESEEYVIEFKIKPVALILLGQDPGLLYKIPSAVQRNIAEEAASDLRSLGYIARTLTLPEKGPALDAIRMTPQPTALVIIGHGDTTGIELQKGNSKYGIVYRGLRLPAGWGKTWQYVILHACKSSNPTSRAEFRKKEAERFEGWSWYTTVYQEFLWQRNSFPSEGPHDGEYELLDIEMVRSLSAEEAAAMPYAGDFDIPESAEAAAKEAFVLLAEAHNDLIEREDDAAMDKVEEAIGRLKQAYEDGWDVAWNIAAELSLFMYGGPVDTIDFTATGLSIGTPVTTHFAHLGVVLEGADEGAAYIVDDRGVPALSGIADGYQGPIRISFIEETVSRVEIEAGLFDEVGSTGLEAYDSSGTLLAAVQNTVGSGLELLVVSAHNIAYVVVDGVASDPWAIRRVSWSIE